MISSVGVGNWLISGGNHIADSTVAKRLQKVVEKACDAQWEMAAALNEIRERRLYRADYPPFETHCKRAHAFSRPRAYQLIDAAEVRKQIEIVYHGRQMPTSERQCRELAIVPENKLR